jgi:hypothetical protein
VGGDALLDWATARGYRQGENPARWRGHLENLLPKQSKIRDVNHHAALPFAEIGEFVKALRAEVGTAARAMELREPEYIDRFHAASDAAGSFRLRRPDWLNDFHNQAYVDALHGERTEHRININLERAAPLVGVLGVSPSCLV